MEPTETAEAGSVQDAEATFRFRYDVEVRFSDLDPMGHAHHTLPLVYIEEARSAYWREIAGHRELDFIIGEVSLAYHRRIRYPATVQVGVRVTRVGRSSFDMEYELRDAPGVLVTGRSSQVLFDYAAGTSKTIPDELRSRLERFEEA